jgi:H+/Na+-translocating ferredoxin:NAD+ oxidoreductase subunit B
MSEIPYEKLAEALDRLPNGFPRTESGIELRILKKLFSPEEAALEAQLTGTWESLDHIAERLEIPARDLRGQLSALAKRGLTWIDRREGKAFFRLAPFVVGFYEEQVGIIDHELAHMVEEYFRQGGAKGIMQPQPALHRVLPAQGAVKSEWVLPYDDVKLILENAKTFNVRDCICRIEQGLLGTRKCDFPLDICISFSEHEREPVEGDISKEQALALLEKSEQIGLVHTVSNVTTGLGYVCNCCGCCCGILRGITEYGIANSVAYANYFAVIDPNLCIGCGTCIERCQVDAILDRDGVSVVQVENCIGCGLCVTGCLEGAARLERKPEAAIVQPPANFETWEQERLTNRGLI